MFVYDGVKFSVDDFYCIFYLVLEFKKFKVCNVIYFKDEVVEYFVDCYIVFEDLYFYGCNFIFEGKWIEYF